MVRALLARGADPNREEDAGVAPIDLAIGKATQSVVRLLLQNGAKPNRTARNGYSLLTTAMLLARPGVADLLKEFGARHGVSQNEQKLLESLPAVVEFSHGVTDEFPLSGLDSKAPPGTVQWHIATVYPDLPKEQVELLVEMAGALADRRVARASSCPLRRPTSEKAPE